MFKCNIAHQSGLNYKVGHAHSTPFLAHRLNPYWEREREREKIWEIEIVACIMDVTGGARGVMVSIAGYGHSDTSSNPGPDWLHFT